MVRRWWAGAHPTGIHHHLEQHDAKAVDVAANIAVFVAALLRAGVGDGAADGGVEADGRRRVAGHLGEAEVDDDGVALVVDKDVRRLEVPVDQALGVSVLYSAASAEEERDGLP
jgi:uncharacterized membrane protein YebE (DUF533 family)